MLFLPRSASGSTRCPSRTAITWTWSGAIATFREAIGAGLTPDEKLFSLGYMQFHGRSPAIRRRFGQLVAVLIGKPPHVTRWHPRWADLNLILEALQRRPSDTGEDPHVLLVSETPTFITTGFPDGGERIHRMRTSRLLATHDIRLAPLQQRFDICLVEVSEFDVTLADRIVERVELLIRDGGVLIMSVMPRYSNDFDRLNDRFTALLSRLMRPSTRSLEFEIVPLNHLRWRALAGLSHLLRVVRTSPRLGYAVAAIAAPPLLTFGWLGNMATRAQRGQVRAQPISSALVTIVIDAERAANRTSFVSPPSTRPGPCGANAAGSVCCAMRCRPRFQFPLHWCNRPGRQPSTRRFRLRQT